ncbi:MAG: hypothetical protein KatS3mg096_387 [Candidatus Parcubacteria bacterium]|nr:MAG: hypothetical protein KatS3mg096_387 [Candidatus Parcubacteria bacterium]
MNNSIQQQNNKKLILIIDDDKNYREILRIKLQSAGYEIIEAENGKEGISLLDQYKPNLILLDVVMPIMNGVDTLFWLKTHPNGKNIKVLIMTNKFDLKEEIGDQYNKIIKKFGALDFFSKSESLDQILKRIKTTLGQ